MIELIRPDSTQDLEYYEGEVNRGIGGVSRDFLHVDGAGPISGAIEVARAEGKVRLLDAGCGSGYGLYDLKNQVQFRAPVDEANITAVGISLKDYTGLIEEPRVRRAIGQGYIDLRLGNLAAIELEPEYYDVAYSYQVLLHNAEIAPILNNVMPALSRGGVYYFDSLLNQQEELDTVMSAANPDQWQLDQVELRPAFLGGSETRNMNRLDCTIHGNAFTMKSDLEIGGEI